MDEKEDITSTESSSSSTESLSSTEDTMKSTKQEHRPLIQIHDENRPQLSIQLPNRWPFKRLARKSTTVKQ